MNGYSSTIGESLALIRKTLPIIVFTIPFIVLYVLYPSSYDLMWKGRTFYLFFLWLVFLETMLNWGRIAESKVNRLKTVRTAVFFVALALPILYVVGANYFGLECCYNGFCQKLRRCP